VRRTSSSTRTFWAFEGRYGLGKAAPTNINVVAPAASHTRSNPAPTTIDIDIGFSLGTHPGAMMAFVQESHRQLTENPEDAELSLATRPGVDTR